MRSSTKPALYLDSFPTYADFFYRNAFIIMKLSHLPSFRAIRALIASQSTFDNKLLHATFYFLNFLLLFVSYFTQVLESFVIFWE